jgi:hypothetical protein
MAPKVSADDSLAAATSRESPGGPDQHEMLVRLPRPPGRIDRQKAAWNMEKSIIPVGPAVSSI